MRRSESQVAIAAGRGMVARRERSLLYVPEPDTDAHRAILAHFLDAADDRAAVTAVGDALIGDEFSSGPLVALRWDTDLHVLVMGAIELRSDHPALPMITGAGSTSWVERVLRTSTPGATVEVVVGDEALDGTDVSLGSVPAGGFRARLALAGLDATPAEVSDRVDEHAEIAHPEFGDPADVGHVDPEPAGDRAHDVPGARIRPLDALQAVTGGDWMEESLGLRPAPASSRSTAPSPAPAPPPSPGAPPLDDEITLAPEDLGLEQAATLPPTTSDRPPAVVSRVCTGGHPNPPDTGRCRTCGAPVDPDGAPVRVPQPVLAVLRLPDGDEFPIDRAYVLGRRPDASVQRPGSHAVDLTAIEVAGDAAISRTHLIVSAEEWTVTVTDCASRSGTAVVPAPGDDPVTLEPWVPHEVPIGATVYLGGPTSVSLGPPPPTASAS